MKSYLSLIPISARVHRRQNRMTLLCIIFAVFLVTAVFSMADMGVRMERASLLAKHGSWNVMLKQIPARDVNQISSMPGISSISVYDAANENQTEFSETSDGNHQASDPVYYVYFQENVNVKKQIAALKEQYGLTEEQIEINKVSLGLADFANNTMVQSLYFAAAVLFVLILIAGVLMISSSINSNVAQRTKFFGMMRCIGMSRRQIVRFVRLEALNWCKTSVPAGILLGIVTTWGLCAALRFLVGEEFSAIPLFGISPIGIVSGAVVGVITVLIAARSPAKRASRVSPVTAVSGNSDSAAQTSHPVRFCMFKIETALGIHHAVSAKKNWLLMTGSFALSIILFLSFSVLIEFVGFLMPQLSNASDINISSSDGSNSIDHALADEIGGMDGVKRVFGRMSQFDVPAGITGGVTAEGGVDLISYGEFDLDCLMKDRQLKKGSDISKVYGDSRYVLATWDRDSQLKIGDTVLIGDETLEIAGLLNFDPFNEDGTTGGKITLITSEQTFTRLTGVSDYSLLFIQTARQVTDADVEAIRNMLDETFVFHDRRDQRTTSTYLAFLFFVYGFLAIITLVTVLNIMNSISMSVTARIKQYGAMRAVGMNGRQITKMIAAETLTYAVSGCAVGCAFGLVLSRMLYNFLIASHFQYAVWSVPVRPLIIILLFVLAAAGAAVYAPAKRIRNISVTETINEL